MIKSSSVVLKARTAASTVLVGCGCPKKSMGWYHAEQLIANRCPSAKLKYVVEPFYMNNSSSSITGYNEFHEWRKIQENNNNIQFFEHVHDVPPIEDDDNEIRMGIISARTADNPILLSNCIDIIGCKTIYLEKPGAPTVKELEDMRTKAINNSCNVYMGFNKNVSTYVTRTIEFANNNNNNNCDVTFVHNNAYPNTDDALAECFERNSEGMLKNMAIHELAILVTYYNVSINNIESVIADKEFSYCTTLRGPSSGKEYTDFIKLKFKIITKDGKSASIVADRCGGDDSIGIITDSNNIELARFTMPDVDTITNIPNLEKLYPNSMPYFFTQDPDYCTLKERIANATITGNNNNNPIGVATIDTAIDTLKLAEYLTPLLQQQLLTTK